MASLTKDNGGMIFRKEMARKFGKKALNMRVSFPKVLSREKESISFPQETFILESLNRISSMDTESFTGKKAMYTKDTGKTIY